MCLALALSLALVALLGKWAHPRPGHPWGKRSRPAVFGESRGASLPPSMGLFLARWVGVAALISAWYFWHILTARAPLPPMPAAPTEPKSESCARLLSPNPSPGDTRWRMPVQPALVCLQPPPGHPQLASGLRLWGASHICKGEPRHTPLPPRSV